VFTVTALTRLQVALQGYMTIQYHSHEHSALAIVSNFKDDRTEIM